ETAKNSKSKTDNQALEEQSIFSEKVIHISEQTLSRDEAIDQLIENLNEQGYITDQSQLKSDVLKREMESTTAIGMNVAIPHAKSAAVKTPIVAVMNNKQGVKWESL